MRILHGGSHIHNHRARRFRRFGGDDRTFRWVGELLHDAEAMAQTNASGQVTNVWSLDGGQYCNNPEVSFAGHTGTGAAG